MTAAVCRRPAGPPVRRRRSARAANPTPAASRAACETWPRESSLGTGLRARQATAPCATLFGVLALVVAALGMYSGVVYEVTQRRHEIGVRMAMGARASQVARLNLREGTRPVLLGIALGSRAKLASELNVVTRMAA